MTSITQQGQTGGDAVAEKRATFSYNADSQYNTIARYANVAGTPQQVATGSYSYDHDGRLTGLTYSQPNSTGLPSYSWSFDLGNRITQMVSPDGTVNYTNDATDQLTAATSSNSQLVESHSYDANGNRTNTGYSTGTNNRLVSDGTYHYTYDNEGNRILRTRISNNPADDYRTEYTWDNRNRMTSVTFKNNSNVVTKTVTYLYDVFDRWIGETIVSGGTTQQTRYVYDGSHIVLQFDKTGTGNLAASNLSHRYLWGAAVDQLLADEKVTSLGTAGSVVWPLADHEGTIRDLATYNSGTNTTTIGNHRVYDAFGVLESQTNAAVDCLFGYTGRPFDKASGEQYNSERWYEAVTGRWLNEDPIGFGGGDANLSRYVGNSPLNLIDPSGLGFVYPGSDNRISGGNSDGYGIMVGYDAEDIDGDGPAEGDPCYAVPRPGGASGGGNSGGWTGGWAGRLPPSVIGQLYSSGVVDWHDRPSESGPCFEVAPNSVWEQRERDLTTARSDIEWAFSNPNSDYARNVRYRAYEANGGQIGSPFLPMPPREDIQNVVLKPFHLVPGVGAVTGAVDASIHLYNGEYEQGVTTAVGAGFNAYASFRPVTTTEQLPTLEFSESRHPALASNIYNAQMAGHPDVLTYGGNAAANRAAALEGVPNIVGLSRDEYPFASTLEGGEGAWIGHIPPAEQSSQGGILKNFYQRNNIHPGTRFRVTVKR